MSATYAEDTGAATISPSVHTTTVAASAGAEVASAVVPKPIPVSRTPVAITRRGGSRRVNVVSGSSSRITTSPFSEIRRPYTSVECPSAMTCSGSAASCWK
jgi:hypothetical protein